MRIIGASFASLVWFAVDSPSSSSSPAPPPSLLKKIERETWRESGISLIATVTRLMERLLDYRDCMKLGEVDGKKIGCTVSLLVSSFVILSFLHPSTFPRLLSQLSRTLERINQHVSMLEIQ